MLCRVFDADEVFDRVWGHASDVSRQDFYFRLSEIVEDPYPGNGNVFGYEDVLRPGTYICTVSFGDGLLVYLVEDQGADCVILLWDVVLY